MVMLIVCNRVNTLFMDLYCTLYLVNVLFKVSFYSINICDRACENRACGHKLHPIALQVISLYWKSIFPFCNLHHDAT